jgi:DNA-binding GntR family transcriptional regulator
MHSRDEQINACGSEAAGHRAGDDRRVAAARGRRAGDEIDADTPDWSDGDWAFHEALYRPSRHIRQIEMIRSLRTTSEMYAAAHRALPQQRKRWLADHRAMVAACRAKQVLEAVVVLKSHLTAARDFVFQQIQVE